MTILPLCLALVVPLFGQETSRSEATESPGAPARVTLSTTPDPVEPAPQPRPPPAPTGHAVVSRVLLEDGQELRGFVVRRDERFLVLELADGRHLQLPARAVKRVEETRDRVREGELWTEDPNRTHYFYSPSGMMLRQGEGSLSLTEGVFATVGYGLTDHLTLQAGSVWPGYFLGFANAMVGVKVGGSPDDKVHLAAGAQGLFTPRVGDISHFTGLTALYGTATYGTPDAHLSLMAAVPFLVAGQNPLKAFLFSLSGNLRVERQVALVTENWVMFLPESSSSPVIIPSVGARLFGTHWAVALGLALVVDSNPAVPLPWVDLTYNFGQ